MQTLKCLRLTHSFTLGCLALGMLALEGCSLESQPVPSSKNTPSSISQPPNSDEQTPNREKTCASEFKDKCERLESEVANLRESLGSTDKNPSASLADKKAALTLERNYKSGLVELYATADPSLGSNESLLQKIYEGQKELLLHSSEASADDPVASPEASPEETSAESSSSEASPASARKPYTEGEHLAVMEVMRELGGLYINVSNKDNSGRLIASEVSAAPPQPWSGYWFPKRRTELFQDFASPLAKFDLMVNRLGGESKSVTWEKAHHDPDAAEWAGLCDAWAMAAISSQEPTKALSLAGVNFDIGDIKALLTKAYEGFRPKIYGRRYLGTAETDGEIQDLRPEAFHRIIEIILGERRNSIVVDDEPGTEVWSKPLFRMRWIVEPDPTYANAVHVTAWPRLVKNRMRMTNTITTPFDMKAPEYQYRLFYDPASEKDGKYLVVYGEWVGASKFEHPDMVLLPLAFQSAALSSTTAESEAAPEPPQVLQPKNPELAKNLIYLKQLISQGLPL